MDTTIASDVCDFSNDLSGPHNVLEDLNEIFGNPCENALLMTDEFLETLNTTIATTTRTTETDNKYTINPVFILDPKIKNELSSSSSSLSSTTERSTPSPTNTFTSNTIKRQRLSVSDSSSSCSAITTNSLESNISNINYYKDELSLKCERLTPSPASTVSTSSSYSNESYGNSGSIGQDIKLLSVNGTHSNLNFSSLVIKNEATINTQQQSQESVISGTLIPISNTPLNTLQLGITNSINSTNNSKIVPKKMKKVILSMNDYKALVQNCNGPVIMNSRKNVTTVKSSTALPKLASKDEITSTHNNLKLINNNNNDNIISNALNLFNHTSKTDVQIDEKALKKQQRMIKNRESALLSRKKKHDYIARLETKLNELSNENNLLKTENNNLKDQLNHLTQNCQCNKIRQQQYQIQQPQKFFETEKGVISSNMRKNTAVLLAMILMVSLNIGSFRTFFLPMTSRNTQNGFGDGGGNGIIRKFEGGIQDGLSGNVQMTDSIFTNRFRRGLLWVNDNQEANKNQNLYANSTSNSSSSSTNCPQYVNQTENMRLATELRKWIEVSDYVNLTSYDTYSSFIGPKFLSPRDSKYYNRNSSRRSINVTNKKRKGLFRASPSPSPPSADVNVIRNILKKDHHRINYMDIFNSVVDDDSGNNDDHQYLKLLKKIRRKDDTFYVLSFNSDHILLPASAYNKTSRPKIALMFPATNDHFFNNNDGKMTLMQIDCEVMNTTTLEFHGNNNNNKENYKSATRRTKLNPTVKTTEGFNTRTNITKMTRPSLPILPLHHYKNKSMATTPTVAAINTSIALSAAQNQHYNDNSSNDKIPTDDVFKKPSSNKIMFKPPYFASKRFLV